MRLQLALNVKDLDLRVLKPGDSFVIAKGTRCTWHMPETTRKYFVIFDAKAAEG